MYFKKVTEGQVWWHVPWRPALKNELYLPKLQAGQICPGRPYLERNGVGGERRIQVHLWSRKLLHPNDSISIVWIVEKERKAPRCFSHRATLKETTGFKGTFLMFYCGPELGSSCCSIPRASLTGWVPHHHGATAPALRNKKQMILTSFLFTNLIYFFFCSFCLFVWGCLM